MAGKDARAHVGDYVRLAWEIMNRNLSGAKILDALASIGSDYPIRQTVKDLVNTDCYEGWTEELRYFFFRYDEYIARMHGENLNELQWSKIWAEEPSRSIEHIRPQSKGPWTSSTSGVFVHRLGNLVLLPPGVNSRLKDKEPKHKAKDYEHCGLLAATELFKMLNKNQGKWDRKMVERRENGPIRWAIKEWAD